MPPAPAPACPKGMTFGPCGGVRDDAGCELLEQRCAFADLEAPVRWSGGAPAAPPASELLSALQRGRAVLTDLTLPSYDAAAVSALVATMAGTCDAFLVGEHQDRPDFPPTVMSSLVRDAGGVPWVTLACRDRNRVVLEQELAGLRLVGADGVLCVTGDGRAPGVVPGVTQVFDLDGTQLAALAAEVGLAVGVPEAPEAAPRDLRPGRLVEKQRAGAHVAVLNHAGAPESVARFVGQARGLGLTIPVVASVSVFTDASSARRLQAFPGLHVDPARVARVLAADDVRRAGIEAAVEEAAALLAVPGVSGVNLSGRGSSASMADGAAVKAEVGRRIKEVA